MRNASELVLGILEEFSALVPREVLMQLYKTATAEPYQMLYINFLAPSVDEMFYKSFESRLVPREAEAVRAPPPARAGKEVVPTENGAASSSETR